MKLEFAHVAINDLKRLRKFIAEKNPAAAQRYSQSLQQSLKGLMLHPKKGRPVEDLENVRELVAGDYVARYKVKTESIVVLKIKHSKEGCW